MDAEKLIIPDRCKAGFNMRSDTYSGKLAYVIYQDAKKVWRKETSWNSWSQFPDGDKREWNPVTKQYDKDKYGDEVAPIEFDNVPTEGFVLNKKVGGGSGGWNHRATYARVYDPRGWEVELSIPNLLYILQETDCVRGKGILGEMVYSWSGKDLVLLPCGASDYQASKNFTNLQKQKISFKELIVGATYKNKKDEELVYLGRLDCIKTPSISRSLSKSFVIKPAKTHVFIEKANGTICFPSSDSLGQLVNSDSDPELVNYLIKYSESFYSANTKFVFLDEKPRYLDNYTFLTKNESGVIELYLLDYYHNYGYSSRGAISSPRQSFLVDNLNDSVTFKILEEKISRNINPDKAERIYLYMVNGDKKQFII